jgi:hypothetical protein
VSEQPWVAPGSQPGFPGNPYPPQQTPYPPPQAPYQPPPPVPYQPPPPVQLVPGQTLPPYRPIVPPAADPARMRVDPIPGTQFGVAFPALPPMQSGPATGSLVAGIASILVALVVGCFGLGGAEEGWGPAVSGAFVVLGVFLGGGALAMGIFALRVIRRSGGTIKGRGVAGAGISCGGTGIGLTLLLFLLAVLVTAGS